MTDCILLKEIQISNNSEVDEDVIMVLTLIWIYHFNCPSYVDPI